MKNKLKIFVMSMIVTTILVVMHGALGNEAALQQHLNENPCMIKVVITEKETCKDSKCLIRETVVTKEEVLHCKDGYDGPSYWQLFAQFYYNQNGLTTPAYCRQYARPDHPFKTPGMICLNQQVIWETKN